MRRSSRLFASKLDVRHFSPLPPKSLLARPAPRELGREYSRPAGANVLRNR